MLRISWSLRWSLCLLLTLFALVTGCESEDDSDSSSSGSVVPGVIDSNGGFNVKINNPPKTDHYIHKAGDFTADCSVASDETSYANQDITCIVEIEELSGAATGLKLVVNAPPTMCKYVVHYPYFYFGLDHGVGPTAVVANFDSSGAFSATGVGTVPVASSITGPGVFSSSGTPICNYDYSNNTGPNCCYGDYTLRTITPTSDTTVSASWGGKAGNCAAGAGLKLTSQDKVNNMPFSQYYYSGSGFNKEFSIEARTIIDSNSSLYYANYYSGADPAAFKMADPTFRGNPYYTWYCYDDAQDTVARIRVQIREWNEVAEFELEASGNPDTTGFEPNWGADVNDYDDWLDVFSSGDNFPGMPEI